MTRFGDVGRVSVGAILRGECHPFERIGWTWADQRGSRSLRRAGQKRALAQIHPRVEVQDRLSAEPPQPHDGRERDDRQQRERAPSPSGRGLG